MENVTPRVDNFIASADSRLQAKNAGELTLLTSALGHPVFK
jgi:hypothetical protein